MAVMSEMNQLFSSKTHQASSRNQQQLSPWIGLSEGSGRVIGMVSPYRIIAISIEIKL